MNIWDIVIIAGIVLLILLAIWLIRRKKGTGCSCGCDGCSTPCNKRRESEKTEGPSSGRG